MRAASAWCVAMAVFAKRLTKTMRAALAAMGLKDASGRPDLFVDYSIADDARKLIAKYRGASD